MEITGRFQGTGRGFGFLIPDSGGEDWFIPPNEAGGAWDGDTVTARALTEQDGARRAARVTAIAVRGNPTVTGRLMKRGRQLWLIPDRDRLNQHILLTGKPKGFSSGDKAAVQMLSFGTKATPPMGSVIRVFGRADSREAGVEAILYNYEISAAFPPAVEEAAGAASSSAAEIDPDRLDLRGEFVITIDGASAKDLDDAVSLTTDHQGRRVLGVHIADVSRFVPRGGVIDREAYERGTSVYFANRVAPMLPAALSNGACSLHPEVDRLTLSCFMTLDSAGDVTDHRIVRSVIRSARRMTYEDSNRLLAGGDEGLEAEYADVLPLLRELHRLAEQRARRRRNRGSLMLETAESSFLFDELGRPVAVVRRGSGAAESLIEECMVLANETVARHLCDRKAPGIFRIHEKPTADKTEGLKTLLSPLGYELKQVDVHAIQKVLDAASGKPEEGAIRLMVLRSMMKARYDTRNLGHYGLGAQYYCHFTSPIRRYPDLMVHRALTALMGDGRELKKLEKLGPEAAEQSSRREVAATAAEREIEKLYMAEYMADKIGESFPAVVSGVTKFGLFVMLEGGVEGLIPVRELPGGGYRCDEARLTLTAEYGGHRFTFGMPLSSVTCTAANPATGEITFALEPRTAGEVRPGPPDREPPGHGRGRDKGRGKPRGNRQSRRRR